MLRFLQYAVPALLLLTLSACEEVIELELDATEQRVVIEANLDAGNGICTVNLSLSGGFYTTNDFDKISGASIELNTSEGGQYTLTEENPGKYTVQGIALSPQQTCTMTVRLASGETYQAMATTPAPVPLDMLMVEKNEGNPMGGSTESAYELTAKWQDLPGMPNYYRLKIYRNDDFQSNLIVMMDDRLGDGSPIVRPIIRQQYALGDTLKCALLSTDEAYYQYFTDIFNAEGKGLSAPAPFNPRGNFDHNVLGYFGIWYLSEMIIVVQ